MKLNNILPTLRLCDWNLARFLRLVRCNRRILSGTGVIEQAFLLRSVLGLPHDVVGTVVECGSYKGSTTAVLSLGCAATGRDLHVFDSFRGLPEPSQEDKAHRLVAQGISPVYQETAWRGSLEEVRRNIEQYGDISVCHFHEGFFDKTLPGFSSPVALAFCDVDLRQSLETCLRYLWPLLADGGTLFTHEAHHYEIASLFYDRDWWQQNLDRQPPGLVGAGSGIGLEDFATGFYSSALGFTVKNPTLHTQSIELGAGEQIAVPVLRDR